MDVHFNCTQCGNCCRNLKLPLTVAEAMTWLTDGRSVQLLCEGMPWLEEPAADDRLAAHRRGRSFAAASGSMPARVTVVLAAPIAGRCPNLQANLQCGIYARRPLVCRVYPAEINPFIRLDPARKGCPPEAWTVDRPLLQRNGQLMDARVRRDILEWQETDRANVQKMRRLCEALNVNTAACVNEGFVAYTPDRTLLLTELVRTADQPDTAALDGRWRFVSNRADTVTFLSDRGAVAALVRDSDRVSYEYLGMNPPSFDGAPANPSP